MKRQIKTETLCFGDGLFLGYQIGFGVGLTILFGTLWVIVFAVVVTVGLAFLRLRYEESVHK